MSLRSRLSFWSRVQSGSRVSRERTLGALAVLAAGLLLSEVNLLSARHYDRFDFSEGKVFSLSHATQQVLGALSEDISITVLLGSGDPRLTDTRQLLETYKARASRLHVEYLDPDRDTAKFLALEQKYGIGTDAITEGGVVADASLLVTSESRAWFIRSDRLQTTDKPLAQVLEGQLTEALVRVGQKQQQRVCFITGHGERSLDDAAEEGLLELRARLTKSNVLAERVPLDVPEPGAALIGCDALVVAGPSRPVPQSHEQALLSAFHAGAGLMLFLDPIVGEDAQVKSAGLARLSRAAGAEVEPAFVLERDPKSRLPEGLGETFFAQTKTHPLTRGLSTDQARLDSRVLMTAAAPLLLAENSAGVVLLSTSDQASIIRDLGHPEVEEGAKGERALAILEERGGEANGHGRALTVGSSSLLQNSSFTDPSAIGNRIFTENAFSWVLSQPTLMSPVTAEAESTALNLTEESLAALLRYVLVYMPLSAACLGALVLIHRSRREQASRRSVDAPEGNP